VSVPHLADRDGRVLGGRYRLVAPIGSGASASVYLGEDLTLGRRVAVKVLHPALADDEAFLRRFRAEAQVAAGLNHPNVLGIHDWGHDPGTPFLVSEFLAGGSLRSMLDGCGTLDASQVLVVGLQAARGLAYAHRRQLVHRDIKPANLLFDDEARLRIADFGLARALAEAAWTEPMGAMLGTARYASPEQARGEPLDGRSDVYSLALVLVEAATGEVPFAADTTLGTLMARVDAPLVVPAELGPVADVLAAAGHHDRATRIDADELAAALLDAARQMDRPGPLPLAGLDPGSASDAGDTDVGVVATGAPPGDEPGIRDLGAADDHGGTPASGEANVVDPAMGDLDMPDLDGPDLDGPDLDGPDLDGGDPGVYDVGADEPDDMASDDVLIAAGPIAAGERPVRRWRRWVAVVAAVAVLAGGAGAVWWNQVRDTTVDVPGLVGVAVAVAERTADDNGWVLQRSDDYHPTLDPGVVTAQTPEAGQPLPEGGELQVVVSLGPAPVPLPDGVVGVPLAEARERLDEVGLTTGEVRQVFDEEVPEGVVVAAGVEPGVEVPFGGAVDLDVSQGPEPRTVPQNLIGRALEEVRGLLNSLGLPVQVGGESFSDDVPAGAVIAAEPTPGEVVDRGTPVRVDVSLGPPVVAIPNVRGQSVVDAAAAIEAAGLVVSSTTGSPTRPVTGTEPSIGDVVRLGTSVTITTR